MSLKYGKKEIGLMADVLDQEHDSVEAAALAALGAAEDILESRTQFAVVGQLTDSKTRKAIPPEDPEAIKLVLGLYSTEGDARTAAESLWHNTSTGDTFRCWVLNVHHLTAAGFHAKQKAKYVALEEKQKDARRERNAAHVIKRQEENQIRSNGGKGACDCTHIKAEHRMDGSSTGQCFLPTCDCVKFKERTK